MYINVVVFTLLLYVYSKMEPQPVLKIELKDLSVDMMDDLCYSEQHTSFTETGTLIRGTITISGSVYANPVEVTTHSQNRVFIYENTSMSILRIVVKYVSMDDKELDIIDKLDKRVFTECRFILAKVTSNYINRTFKDKLIIMPYVRYNLAQYYAKVVEMYEEFPLPVLIYIISKVVSSFLCLTKKGYYYLDIKPENILIDDNLLEADFSRTESASVTSLPVYICDIGAIIKSDTRPFDIDITVRAPDLDLGRITDKDMVWYIGYTILRLLYHPSELNILSIIGNIETPDTVLQYTQLVQDLVSNKLDSDIRPIASNILSLKKEDRFNLEELSHELDGIVNLYNVQISEPTGSVPNICTDLFGDSMEEGSESTGRPLGSPCHGVVSTGTDISSTLSPGHDYMYHPL